MEGLTSAIGTAMTDISGDVLGILAIVVPVALGIFGAFLAVKYAKKFFSSISK